MILEFLLKNILVISKLLFPLPILELYYWALAVASPQRLQELQQQEVAFFVLLEEDQLLYL
jgi:hypothetical protein